MRRAQIHFLCQSHYIQCILFVFQFESNLEIYEFNELFHRISIESSLHVKFPCGISAIGFQIAEQTESLMISRAIQCLEPHSILNFVPGRQSVGCMVRLRQIQPLQSAAGL